jgi:hypothetical protein
VRGVEVEQSTAALGHVGRLVQRLCLCGAAATTPPEVSAVASELLQRLSPAAAAKEARSGRCCFQPFAADVLLHLSKARDTEWMQALAAAVAKQLAGSDAADDDTDDAEEEEAVAPIVAAVSAAAAARCGQAPSLESDLLAAAAHAAMAGLANGRPEVTPLSHTHTHTHTRSRRETRRCCCCCCCCCVLSGCCGGGGGGGWQVAVGAMQLAVAVASAVRGVSRGKAGGAGKLSVSCQGALNALRAQAAADARVVAGVDRLLQPHPVGV